MGGPLYDGPPVEDVLFLSGMQSNLRAEARSDRGQLTKLRGFGAIWVVAGATRTGRLDCIQ